MVKIKDFTLELNNLKARAPVLYSTPAYVRLFRDIVLSQ